MQPTDPRLTVIAQIARVRPPHVFHTLHAMGEPGFDPQAFATFAMLELRHVESIIAALTEKGWLPTKAKRAERKERATALPLDFKLPEDWHAYAVQKRSWSDADIIAEAETFALYWHANGRLMVSWLATWKTWVGRSRRPDGSRAVDPAKGIEGRIAHHLKMADSYERMGKEDDAAIHRQKASVLRSENVVPFRLQA